MEEDDTETLVVEESQLESVRFDEVDGLSCWCGEPYQSKHDGTAYCPVCARRGFVCN